MTIEDAVENLENGELISHRFFGEDEYIQKVNGRLIDENQYVFDEYAFWFDRTDDAWNDGWFIYEY